MDKGRLHLIFVNLWKWKAKDRECLKMMCKLLGRKTEWGERERERAQKEEQAWEKQVSLVLAS